MGEDGADTREEMERLARELERHNRLYYVEGTSEISDREYDEMFRRLEELEEKHPEWASDNSPTRRVGGEPIEGFKQREHLVPMLSIDDLFSEEEVGDFYRRLQKGLEREQVDVMIEPKIDGVAVALHYEDGEFSYALTRGDGTEGDLITENVRTIRSIPLRLDLDDAPGWLEVRGEIFMPNEKFAEMNEQRDEDGLAAFKNPRNATAGSLKLLDPREVARRPLDFIAHGVGRLDGWRPETFPELREFLEQAGIPLNGPIWMADSCDSVLEAIHELDEKRHGLGHATDGAVIKVVDFASHERLGATSRAPRWLAAYKYAPEQKETVLREITVQVGRTGTLTPVAELDPVDVSGSTVRRATLHNQDEIDRKDVRVGDTVLIEKAGEIIPAVVKVIPEKRPSDAEPFDLYEAVDGKCPSCGEGIVREEGFVAWKCVNPICPAKSVSQVKQFVSRKALDIEGVGSIVSEKLVERGLVSTILDLFDLSVEQLADLNLGTEGEPRVLGEKNATRIVDTVERARTMPLHRWLFGLGIPHVGESAARELARLHRDFESLADSDVLEELRKLEKGQRKEDHSDLRDHRIASEVGPSVAGAVLDFFQSDAGQYFLSELKKKEIHPTSENYAPKPDSEEAAESMPLAGKTLVITGTLSAPRDEIKDRIAAIGGKVTGSVSKNTDFLLAGEGGGSKSEKAESLGVEIIDEETFFERYGEKLAD